jgi:hypothetical protein
MRTRQGRRQRLDTRVGIALAVHKIRSVPDLSIKARAHSCIARAACSRYRRPFARDEARPLLRIKILFIPGNAGESLVQLSEHFFLACR